MTKQTALIHDHLAQNGGAERVLQVLQALFPEAPTFTTVWDKRKSDPAFLQKDIRTSFIQRLPWGVRRYQWYLPLMPPAFERFDLDAYKLIISSASGLAKGIIVPEGSTHVCYCYTPTRYLWGDRNSYVDALRIPKPAKGLLLLYLNYLRVWDFCAASRVDHFIAISKTVQDRIKKYYRRDSDVIHPPVQAARFTVGKGDGGYYLTGGRLKPYKRFDITVKAFSRLNLPLFVFGDGPEKEHLQRMARPNVKFIGRVPDVQLPKLYRDAIAFVNPQVEDFGITMVESLASGRPVIAYKGGGAKEIVSDGQFGTLFDEQSWESLADAVTRFRSRQFDPETIRKHAETFSVERFKEHFMDFLRSHHLHL